MHADEIPMQSRVSDHENVIMEENEKNMYNLPLVNYTDIQTTFDESPSV